MPNPLITNYNRAKLFIWDNRYEKIAYTNATGSEITIPKGRVMGRIITGVNAGKLQLHTRTATDGSEMPRFVLADDYVVAIGATVNLTVCNGGDVDKALLVWNSGDTADSVLDEYMTSPATDYDRVGTLGDLLTANSTLKLIVSTEMTNIDNPQ